MPLVKEEKGAPLVKEEKGAAADEAFIMVEEAVAAPKRSWRANLCGCLSDPGSCLLSFLLPSVLFGLNQERAFVGESCCKWFSLLILPPLIFEGVWDLYVGPLFVKWLEASMHDDARALSLGFGLFRLVCWLMVMMWMIHLRMARRAALRAKLDINGSTAADCAAVTVCGPCALAQEAREIKYSFVPVPVEQAALAPVQPIAEAVLVTTASGAARGPAGARGKLCRLEDTEAGPLPSER